MKTGLAIMLLALLAVSPGAGEFCYEVKRDKLWGAEPGVLTIDEGGIRYRSENEKTAFDFAFEDIRKADVSDARRIRLYTYDRAKKRLTGPSQFEFKLRQGTTEPALAQFLAARLARPVVGAYPVGENGRETPAYHQHVLGGCHGVLRFGDEAVVFESDNPQHSRTWTCQDIQTIGTMNPFHFRLTSYAETFNFGLKQRLSLEDYREVWHWVYARGFDASDTR